MNLVDVKTDLLSLNRPTVTQPTYLPSLHINCSVFYNTHMLSTIADILYKYKSMEEKIMQSFFKLNKVQNKINYVILNTQQ